MNYIIINGEKWDIIPPSGAIGYYRYRDPRTGNIYNLDTAYNVVEMREAEPKPVPLEVQQLVRAGWQYVVTDKNTRGLWRSPYDGGLYYTPQALEAQKRVEAKGSEQMKTLRLMFARRAV